MANPTAELDVAYRVHVAKLLAGRVFVAAVTAAAVVVLDIALALAESLTGVTELGERGAALVTVVAIALLARGRFAVRLGFGLSVALVVVMSSELMAAVVRTGGARSPYIAGAAILVVAAGLFFPYSARRMAGVAAVMLTIYVVPLIVAGIPNEARDASITAFVLLAATLCAIIGTHQLDRLRRTELAAGLALREEQAKAERLLLNILPKPIADRLKEDERSIADAFSDVTVLFADIVGFTELSSHTSPEQLVAFLNQVFSAFDGLAERLGLEKIKTIGDAYMVAGGLPEVRSDHARAVAEMALGMRDVAASITRPDGNPLQIRIGLNTGPVVAGVIGRKKFIYDLWGDAVNTASRMESHSTPSSIHVAPSTYELLKADYRFEPRGMVDIKGKGAMATYFLLGRG